LAAAEKLYDPTLLLVLTPGGNSMGNSFVQKVMGLLSSRAEPGRLPILFSTVGDHANWLQQVCE
jgi:hypothetical protein